MKKTNTLKAIDFFCGSGGMTSGFKRAGIEVLAGIDIEKACEETYSINNKPAKFLCEDIKEMNVEKLVQETGIEKEDDKLVFIGCSPCQYWSIISTDKTKAEGTKNLLLDFQRFVKHFKPGYIVLENVPGILTRKESPLQSFLTFLSENGYEYDYEIVNVSHYGVPQTRKRFVLIASRVTGKKGIKIPEPDTKEKPPTVGEFIIDDPAFYKIEHGHKDPTDFNHTVAGLHQDNIERLKLTPEGCGNEYWRNTPLGIPAHKKSNGFKDVYGRMHRNKVGPTITTKFFSISNGRFGHPTQLRAISIREGATLQTFDKSYVFKGNSIAANSRMIGNAVPPALAERLAKAIINNEENAIKIKTTKKEKVKSIE
ncbi:DNA cytosine methyltransferase [Methanimicrococcus hongohii]|nr:DNA cytosine methyltransferase [Methanimicrococcus sp. Hf6]